MLQHVDEDSPAWEAGLRPGFVITHVNGEVSRTIYLSSFLSLGLGMFMIPTVVCFTISLVVHV